MYAEVGIPKITKDGNGYFIICNSIQNNPLSVGINNIPAVIKTITNPNPILNVSLITLNLIT